jgi:hypothetical protein
MRGGNRERELLVMPESPPGDEEPGEGTVEQPWGTFVLLLFYLLLTAVLWGSVYLLLWQRR